MDKVHTYKGHNIVLDAVMKKSGWMCRFILTSLDPQNPSSYDDFTAENYSTEEEAKQVALQTAKRWIDNPHSHALPPLNHSHD